MDVEYMKPTIDSQVQFQLTTNSRSTTANPELRRSSHGPPQCASFSSPNAPVGPFVHHVDQHALPFLGAAPNRLAGERG